MYPAKPEAKCLVVERADYMGGTLVVEVACLASQECALRLRRLGAWSWSLARFASEMQLGMGDMQRDSISFGEHRADRTPTSKRH